MTDEELKIEPDEVDVEAPGFMEPAEKKQEEVEKEFDEPETPEVMSPERNAKQVKTSVKLLLTQIVKDKEDDTRNEEINIKAPTSADVEKMRKRIVRYFDKCDAEKLPVETQYGKETAQKQNKPYTIAGMTLALGLSSRDELRRYRKTEGFVELLGWAMLKIEEQRNENLLTRHGNVAGLIFDLKNNFKWRDTPDSKRIGLEITLEEALAEISGESRGLPKERMEQLRPRHERKEVKLRNKDKAKQKTGGK